MRLGNIWESSPRLAYPERSFHMRNYCLALDVAKGKSMVVLVSKEGEVMFGPEDVAHSSKGLQELFDKTQAITNDYVVFMEATNVYHEQPEQFFKSRKKEVIVTNALLTSFYKTSLRKTKTDKLDCLMLANAYFHGSYTNYFKSCYEVSLQPQGRTVENLAGDIARLKVNYLHYLSRCFPILEIKFKRSIYCHSMLKLLSKWPHPDIVDKKNEEQIFKLIKGNTSGNGGHRLFATNLKTIDLYEIEPSVTKDDPSCHVLSYYAFRLMNLKGLKEKEDEAFIAAAKKSKYFEIYNSFNGVGELLSAYLTAELGDLLAFENKKKLIAFCGLDPMIKQSGRSIDINGPISKRGNKHLRIHLYQAVIMILRDDGLRKQESDITTYYKKKRSDGKHHYAAVIACSTKLLRKFYFRAKEILATN